MFARLISPIIFYIDSALFKYPWMYLFLISIEYRYGYVILKRRQNNKSSKILTLGYGMHIKFDSKKNINELIRFLFA